MAELPDVAFIELAPDRTCEVLSPSTARADRVLERHVYARQGVGHHWLIDPDGWCSRLPIRTRCGPSRSKRSSSISSSLYALKFRGRVATRGS
jgi:hypothetical protein